jgi:hypothetical protein
MRLDLYLKMYPFEDNSIPIFQVVILNSNKHDISGMASCNQTDVVYLCHLLVTVT